VLFTVKEERKMSAAAEKYSLSEVNSEAIEPGASPEIQPENKADVEDLGENRRSVFLMDKDAAAEKYSLSEVNSEAIEPEAPLEIQPENKADVEDLGENRRFVFLMDKDEMKESTQDWCCPHGIDTHSIPLLLVLIATVLTFAGSWTCSYFNGATTGFTGNSYGLWTLEGTDGKCHPWDTLFFSYSLGDYLEAARVLSMTAMILGISLLTAMSQALKCHFVSWSVGLAFFALFITSLARSQEYNIWTLFFFFLYVVLVLIVRSLFIHPVHRAISSRGSKYIAWLLILNFVLTILTLLVLNSDFCQCYRLTNEKLEGRLDPSLDPCKNKCELGPAGTVIIIGAAAWLLAGLAVFKFGVQPKDFVTEESARFGGYRGGSITTKALEDVSKAAKVPEKVVEISKFGAREAVNLGKKATTYATVLVGYPSDTNAFEEGGVGQMTGEENAGDEKLPAKNEDLHRILEEKDDDFQRTCCQKICCDFRVTERTRKEKTLFWCFRFALVALYAVFVIAVVISVGSRYENGAAENSPSTTPNFITNVTCAFNPLDPSAPFVTYMSPEKAAMDNMTIAHCGPCGFCSNMEDIEAFVTTRKTITAKIKECGQTAVLGSTDDLHDCVKGKVNFTDDCRTCWVKNIECDTSRCLFTCMKTMFTGAMSKNSASQGGDIGRLNWCLNCDERRCGTAFVTCTGVARRRLGIRSDIDRNADEICPLVKQFGWTTYFE
jgi:hypothetical protein